MNENRVNFFDHGECKGRDGGEKAKVTETENYDLNSMCARLNVYSDH